ncbi:thioredoxin domain-containing protein 12-like [Bradysia coprophila]|uniref:thioredoxin domain-containing protein 12-like n=1 Tax=Bradysia coprophila TaxID=38358 RepID=UPI00187DC22F|nr:thioredoxin domain-containing protein 12-like [Bradysia coprophila]
MKRLTEIIVLLILAVFQVKPSDAASDDLRTAFSFAKNLETAYQQAKSRSLPIMLITHKSTCPACIRLRPKLTGSNEVITLSHNFIMVNNGDREDAKAEAVRPDGGNYYPRIIFFDKFGNVLGDIINASQPKYKYYFSTEAQVVAAMKEAIDINKRI